MLSPRRLGWVALMTGALLLPGAPAGAAPMADQTTWHADQVRLADAQAAGRDGEGVVVAVLDSWVDASHPDFGGRVLPGADCLGAVCAPGPAARDSCDHGTHVAGTVAASSFGVATGASVLPVRVLAYDEASGTCTGRPADVTAGIRWAVRNGAQVLNLSLGPDVPGLTGSSSIPAAVDEAARAGVVVVFSAGSTSLPVTDSYGGSAIIVAATGPDGALASYSQRGSGVDLAAPGGDPRTPDVCRQDDCVTSLFPGGRYSVAAGTSMAAPHVSGIAALLLGQDPQRSRQQVLERLLSSAHPLADAGRGLVDARAALSVPTAAPAGAQPSLPTAAVTVAPERPVAPAAPAPPAPVPPVSPQTPAASLPPTPPVTSAPSPPEQVPDAEAAPPPGGAPPPAPANPVPAWPAALAVGVVVAVGAAIARLAHRP